MFLNLYNGLGQRVGTGMCRIYIAGQGTDLSPSPLSQVDADIPLQQVWPVRHSGEGRNPGAAC